MPEGDPQQESRGTNGERLAVLEVKLDAEVAITEERFKSRDMAVAGQLGETARRLTELNGEAERLRDVQARYLPREVWDVGLRELRAGGESRDGKLGELQGRLSLAEASLSTLSGGLTWLTRLIVGAVILALLGLLFAFLKQPNPIPVSLK